MNGLFKCNECAKEYKNESVLNNHKTKVHQPVQPVVQPVVQPPVSPKTFKCNECAKEYKTETVLNNHKTKAHSQNVNKKQTNKKQVQQVQQVQQPQQPSQQVLQQLQLEVEEEPFVETLETLRNDIDELRLIISVLFKSQFYKISYGLKSCSCGEPNCSCKSNITA